MMKSQDVLSLTGQTTSTAKAVVIGCSCTNQSCDHGAHPSSDDFYCIDIDEKINPDLCLDIAKDKIPPNLQNHFKLTILECLPYFAYNHDEVVVQISGSDGNIGMMHARQLTDENGFILVIGNSRAMHWRSSFGDLHYLEIGVTNDPSDDFYVVLIPNNQTMTASEIQEQIKALPAALQDSITNVTRSNGCQPVEKPEFCILNYKVSEKNQAMIEALNSYISKRRWQDDYKVKFKIFGKELKFGFSRDEKVKGAAALVSVLLGNKPVESLKQHKGVLSNGELGQIISRSLKTHTIQELIQPSATEKGPERQTTQQYKAAYKDAVEGIKHSEDDEEREPGSSFT